MSDVLAYLIGALIGLLMFWAFVLMADDAQKAKEYCASIGMFPDKNAGEWICIDRPKWRMVPT